MGMKKRGKGKEKKPCSDPIAELNKSQSSYRTVFGKDRENLAKYHF